jgi:FkbM family methyltransferase
VKRPPDRKAARALIAGAQDAIQLGEIALDPNARRLYRAARRRGLRIRFGRDAIEVANGRRAIWIQLAHWFYASEIMDSFDHYFSAVAPVVRGTMRVVDYSFPHFHEVVGYARQPVFFPSFAEPMAPTGQYTDFAALEPGVTVIDLGAYAGLTSMVFQDAVGGSGTVVAVEADDNNVNAIRKNFALYRSVTGVDITLVEGAAWNDDAGIVFSSDGNMGSSAAAIVGPGRGPTRTVPTFTLSAIAERTGLDRVDFVKCDIEGAEAVVFADAAFFRRFGPKIIVEPHWVDGTLTTEALVRDLEVYGYACRTVPQRGYATLPLVECCPPPHRT